MGRRPPFDTGGRRTVTRSSRGPSIRYPTPMLLLLLAACPAPETPANATGDGLFTQGCPVPGQAAARSLKAANEAPWGSEALAGPGDVVLLNEKAAFVIQNVDDVDTYYHYGGQPIDAVAVDGCEQAGPELFEEMGFLVGQLELTDFNQSTLHQVRGEAIRIVADGSDGGPAIVEVDATDDRFWLVEETLARAVWNSGGRKPLGDLYGLDMTLRYTLDPGATALQMEVILDGEPVTDGFVTGALVFPSDEVDVNEFANGNLDVGGFGLDLDVPWLAMGRTTGAQAVAMPDSTMAYTEVAGVRALLDMGQALAPLEVTGAAEPPSTRFLLSVGPTDAASASAGFEPYFPEPVKGSTWADVSGTVADAAGPVAGATVTVYADNGDGDAEVLDTLVTDASGRFSGRTLKLAGPWTLVASADGRDDSAAVEISSGPAALQLGAAGKLTIDAVDDAGVGVPVRVELQRDDGAHTVRYALPGDTVDLPPGTWHAWVTHGYEDALVQADVVVPESGEGTLSVTVAHVVDTTGWASIDTHVHQEASADSRTLATERFRTVAASGLDIMVSTDHEAIIDLSDALDASGAGEFLTYGLGSEVTAVIPEHTNPWPMPPDEADPRGSPVRWYGLGFPGIYAAERARGARVIQLNHSRVNGECGILCVLDWDRGADDPATDDPEALAMPAAQPVWSWDFDAFELLNSARSPLLDPADPRHTGALVDWFAFLNLGHPVTGTAVTDVHEAQIPGEPRTYVRVADDSQGAFTVDDAADAELEGAAVISAGAFATVEIAGAGPGDVVSVGDGAATLHVNVQAIPEIDVAKVYVLVDCDLVATLDATDPAGVVKLDADVPLTLARDAYVVVLGFGDEDMPRGFDDYDQRNVPRVLTNPIFVDVDGDGAWTAPGAKTCATGVEVNAR